MSALASSPQQIHWAHRPPNPEGLTPDDAMRPTLTVVIPTRNEAGNIELVLQALPNVVEEVIVIDASDDDVTARTARRAWPGAIVRRQRGLGKGNALREGFARSRGRYVVMLDGDGSMDPAEIQRFVRLLDDGFEFVKGSRFMTGGGTSDMTPFRKFGHSGLLFAANLFLRARYTDLCYGYCAFRRSALERLELDADGFEIETQIVARAALAGLAMAEIPSYEHDRLSGRSKLSPIKDGIHILITLLRERFRWRPRPVPAPRAPRVVDAIKIEPDGGVE